MIKTIQQHIDSEPDNYLVVKILSNKFAIVRHAVIFYPSKEKGFDDRDSVIGLRNGKVYGYGGTDTVRIQRYLDNTQNIYREAWPFYGPKGKTIWRPVTFDYRKSKQEHRKLITLLKLEQSCKY